MRTPPRSMSEYGYMRLCGGMLKQARRGAHVTLRDFCRHNGLHALTVSRIERGDFTLPEKKK